ncbi:hypothetical protein MMC25_004546 [Agyrium rufum]|nr:hypothetical protein [Agyrium rufum]
MAVKVVVIAGFSGKFARSVTQHLLNKSSDIQIHGLIRNPSKVPEAFQSNPQIKIFQGDAFDKGAALKAVTGADVTLCAYLGDNNVMTKGQETLIEASIEAKVSRYIASDFSLDYNKIEMGQLPPKDPMKKIAAYLAERKDQIAAVHPLNGSFMPIWFSPMGGIFFPKESAFKVYGDGEGKIDVTTYDTAAEYVAEIMLDETATGTLMFRGDRVSVKDMAAAIKSVYGKEITVESRGSLDDLYNIMFEALQKDPRNVYSWLPKFYNYWSFKEQGLLERNDNSRYPGVKPTSLVDYMKNTKYEMLPNGMFF